MVFSVLLRLFNYAISTIGDTLRIRTPATTGRQVLVTTGREVFVTTTSTTMRRDSDCCGKVTNVTGPYSENKEQVLGDNKGRRCSINSVEETVDAYDSCQ